MIVSEEWRMNMAARTRTITWLKYVRFETDETTNVAVDSLRYSIQEALEYLLNCLFILVGSRRCKYLE